MCQLNELGLQSCADGTVCDSYYKPVYRKYPCDNLGRFDALLDEIQAGEPITWCDRKHRDCAVKYVRAKAGKRADELISYISQVSYYETTGAFRLIFGSAGTGDSWNSRDRNAGDPDGSLYGPVRTVSDTQFSPWLLVAGLQREMNGDYGVFPYESLEARDAWHSIANSSECNTQEDKQAVLSYIENTPYFKPQEKE